MQRNPKTVIASSGGLTATGRHIVSPGSVISYVYNNEDGIPQPNAQVYQTLASDTVSFLINPLWTHTVINVQLPLQKLFDHVKFDPVLIQHWVMGDTKMGE